MKNFNLLLLLLSGLLLFNACLKEAEMEPPLPVNEALALCDSLQPNISYSDTILVKLGVHGCFGCHSVSQAPNIGGNIILEGHENFSDNAERVLAAIDGSGDKPMPPNSSPGTVDSLTVAQLECWILRGKNDN